MRFDTNKVFLTGRIEAIESVTTKKLVKAVNLFIATENKYIDISPCQAYGLLAEQIEKEYPIGTSVIIIGRLRSVATKDVSKNANWVVIEKIARELIIENDGGDQ